MHPHMALEVNRPGLLGPPVGSASRLGPEPGGHRALAGEGTAGLGAGRILI